MGHFNIRVYGILINNENEVLISDELINNKCITKFPGGGLEFGEGVIDCLKREFMEETGMEIEVTKHFYTTDFFQPSAYHKDHQIISIYYLVSSSQISKLTIKQKAFDFDGANEQQCFRWLLLSKISSKDFSLPIDKVVIDNLLGWYDDKQKNKAG